MSDVTKKITSLIQKHACMFINQHEDKSEMKYLKAHSSQKLGRFWFVYAPKQDSRTYKANDRFIPNRVLTKHIGLADVYKMPKGLAIVTEYWNLEPKADGLIYVRDLKFVQQMERYTKPENEGGVRSPFGTHDYQDGALVTYLLHGDNLYWDVHEKAYDVHDRTLLNLMTPHFKRNQMHVRHQYQRKLLGFLIAGLKPVLLRFAYTYTHKKTTYADYDRWSAKSHLAGPAVQQTNLFSKPKSVHTTGLRSINPNNFIHQLAAVSDRNVFYVSTNCTQYGDFKGVDSTPEVQDLSEFHLAGKQAEWASTAQDSTDAFEPLRDRAQFTYSQLVRVQDPDDYNDNAVCHDGIWLNIETRARKAGAVQDSIFMYKDFNSTLANLKREPGYEFITSNKADLESAVDKFRKLYPSGFVYTVIKFGPHLYNVSFAKVRQPYDGILPCSPVPLLGVYWIESRPQTFKADLYSDYRYAARFGKKSGLRFVIDDRGYFRHHAEDDDDGYYLPSEHSVGSFVIAPDNRYALHHFIYPDHIGKTWLDSNQAYKKFIENV